MFPWNVTYLVTSDYLDTVINFLIFTKNSQILRTLKYSLCMVTFHLHVYVCVSHLKFLLEAEIWMEEFPVEYQLQLWILQFYMIKSTLKTSSLFHLTLESSFCDKCGNIFMGQFLATEECALFSVLTQVLNILLWIYK